MVIICYASAEISCVQHTSHFSLGISFKLCKWLAMAAIWPPYSFGSPGVKRKSGILWIMHGHRPQRFFYYVQPASHIPFGILVKLCKWLVMAEILPPYSFCSPGVKIMLWGVKTHDKF